MKRIAAIVIFSGVTIGLFLKGMWLTLNPYGGLTVPAFLFAIAAIVGIQMFTIVSISETKRLYHEE